MALNTINQTYTAYVLHLILPSTHEIIIVTDHPLYSLLINKIIFYKLLLKVFQVDFP
jgi:hypothetical protein